MKDVSAAVSGAGVSGQVAYWTDSVGSLTGFPSVLNKVNGSLALGTGSSAGASGATVAGGFGNLAASVCATVAGGYQNTAADQYATVGGGYQNSGGYTATVAGGSYNLADGSYSTVGGGYSNSADGDQATVAGGEHNLAVSDWATVAGGHYNSASGQYSTIAGGDSNVAGDYATVAGGSYNSAAGTYATVGGGNDNVAAYDYATVGGGESNTVSGYAATVPGGYRNTAGANYSFAAGQRATVLPGHHGAVLFSDDSFTLSGVGVNFNSVAADEFAVRATGGARFVTAVDTSGKALTQMTVNSSGSLGVKNANPGFDVHVIGTTDPASVTVDGIGIVGPNFQFRRARGTAGSPSAVLSGDGLLFLVGKGYGSTGFSAGGRANLSMFAAHTWTDTAQGTFMSFKTTASGTTTQTEKMRITDTGNILPPADNSGSIGIASQRWALVRAVTITPGDLVFENGYRVTEDRDSGLSFLNDKGARIARLDEQGNFYVEGNLFVKGKKIDSH